MNPLHDECAGWLQKARNDLVSARVLLGNSEPITDTACFHCQQSVEKVLKAFLVFNGIKFEKVHSLPYLLDLCERSNASINEIREIAESLAPFAVEARYPGDLLEIALSEAHEALKSAEAVVQFIKRFFPGELALFLNMEKRKGAKENKNGN